jgi:N-acetyl-gamma-glutamyl-phosphate reductase
MNRGILATIYVRCVNGKTPRDLSDILAQRFQGEAFIRVLPFGAVPQTRHVRGSNMVHMSVCADRQPDRAILLCVLDNLVKGASGQAIQNMNAMLGFPETLGIDHLGVFP